MAADGAAAARSSGQKLGQQSYECRLLNPICDPGWDRLAESHSGSGIFHSSAWARVLSKTYGHEPRYLHFSQGSRVVALLPLMEVASSLTGRRGVSLPFSDFCEALLFEENAQSFVIHELSELARRRCWKFFELRGGTNPQASASPSAAFYGHEIDLSQSEDHLFARFADSVRRAIRKASKSGVVAEVSRNREALTIFYQLHLRTRRRHGLPPQPFRFFRNVQKQLIENRLGFVVLARAASRPVAAAVFFQWGKKALYKYAASDERYQQFRGNDLVLWQAIKSLRQEKAGTLHLGRTSFEDSGLRRFKLGWAVTEQILHYFRFDVAANLWLSNSSLPGTLHKKVFGRLPLKLNQLAGSIIYRHLD
jgi:Acetyltransferase (GNAT) domain